MSDHISLYAKYVVELEENGSRWKGLCPFHVEDTPSFFVFDDFEYHCFGCGAHGTFKDFLSYFEEEDHFVLVGLESVKNIEILKLQELENALFDELFGYVISESYETKKKVWARFDAIWLNLKFLGDANSLEKLLFVRGAFKRLVSEVLNET